MRIHRAYVLTLSTLLLAITLIVTFYEEENLGLYFSLYAGGYLVVTTLFGHLSADIARSCRAVSLVLITAFVITVGLEICYTLWGRLPLP